MIGRRYNMSMNEEERIKRYDLGVFLGNKEDTSDRERYPYHQMRLKKPIFDAMCYAYGFKYYEAAEEAFHEPAETFVEQIQNIKKYQTREPKLVLDIGAGRGELTVALLYDGVECYAVDPSPGSADIVPHTFKKWIEKPCTQYFINTNFLDGVTALLDKPIDTVILCEAIEHIREDEFNAAMLLVEKKLSETGGLLIITNWVGFHPINVDNSGWDHIREINDTVYNGLCKTTNKTMVRKGSHLVLKY